MRKARERILLHIQVTGDIDKAFKLISENDGAEATRRDGDTIIVTLKPEVEDYSYLSKLIHDNGFGLKLFREEEVNLETAFMELTKGVQQ